MSYNHHEPCREGCIQSHAGGCYVTHYEHYRARGKTARDFRNTLSGVGMNVAQQVIQDQAKLYKKEEAEAAAATQEAADTRNAVALAMKAGVFKKKMKEGREKAQGKKALQRAKARKEAKEKREAKTRRIGR